MEAYVMAYIFGIMAMFFGFLGVFTRDISRMTCILLGAVYTVGAVICKYIDELYRSINLQ